MKFPHLMREFLQHVGWVQANSFALFGLGSDCPPLMDIVKASREWQRYKDEPLIKGLVPLSGELGDISVCLDCRPNVQVVTRVKNSPMGVGSGVQEYIVPGPTPKIDKRLFKSMMSEVLPTAITHARPTYKVVYWDFDYDPMDPGLKVGWESYAAWLRWEVKTVIDNINDS